MVRLGQGWAADEALAISVCCALVTRTFEEGVILAVNHDGDSDSTGSITGQLLGARDGVEAIPREWLEPLELCDVIEELTRDLYAFPDWDLTEDSQGSDAGSIWKKYPGF